MTTGTQAAIALPTLVEHIDRLLQVDRFSDYCPNGLQVEGRARVERIVCGVTACEALLEAALDLNADAVLVHHGYFWRGEDPCVRGMKRRRLLILLKNEISLLGYHLPLDAHPELGNNAQLGRILGFEAEGPLIDGTDSDLVWTGTLDFPITAAALGRRIEEKLGRVPLHIGAAEAEIRRVAWCTGAAQGFIEAAVHAGVDAYITGEASEQTVHVARECGLHFYAAGHHATERYGVQALGKYLTDAFGIRCPFVDIANPV
jgi:dinuclear metal center YbgI/SA1388 family protein